MKKRHLFYDEKALHRLQNILLFRELQFPLKEIKSILDNPDFDPGEALAQQIQLLELRKKHIEDLISLTREIQEGGTDQMNFHAFQKTEIEQYEEEVKERWGSTKAYKEYEEKMKGKSKQELDAAANKMLELFAEIGQLQEHAPGEDEVQKKIEELQTFITQNYYHCTDEILQGLGEMYVSDERMKRNIDKAGGEGTAEFARQAISVYFRRQ